MAQHRHDNPLERLGGVTDTQRVHREERQQDPEQRHQQFHRGLDAALHTTRDHDCDGAEDEEDDPWMSEDTQSNDAQSNDADATDPQRAVAEDEAKPDAEPENPNLLHELGIPEGDVRTGEIRPTESANPSG